MEYELGERPPNDPKDIVMADEIEKEVEEMEEYEEETTFEEDADGIMHGSDGSYVGPLMQNRRDAKAPYVINIDEFTNEKSEYDKVTLTYFDGDDVLIDTDDDSEIDDVEEIIGRSWKGAFGIGSDDEDIVYVRNEGLAIDYEVVRTWNRYLGGLDIHDLAEKVAPIPKRKRFDDAEEE